MLCLFIVTINVSNVIIHILAGSKIVKGVWKRINNNSTQRSWCVQIVVKGLLRKIALNMGKNIWSLSANFVVLWLCGFVGML